MKLISVTVNGFRRFKNETKMDLDGKLIAIVGANEAGKSSFLEVLQELDTSKAFITKGASQEISRGLNLSGNHKVVKALYLVEGEDRAKISHIEDSQKIKWFTYSKAVNSVRYYSVEPNPERSLKHRKNTIKSLDKALKDIIKYEKTIEENKDEEQTNLIYEVVREIENLSLILQSTEQNYQTAVIERFRTLAKKMLSSGIAAEVIFLQKLAPELEELADKESIHPSDECLKELSTLRPSFLFFDENARNLEPEYNLTEIGESVPQALENVLKLAKLDLQKLLEHIKEEDQGQIATILEDANEHLKKVFEISWSQSSVHVHLDVNGELLHILIKEPDRAYVRIAERSDGLRQYVALLSFVTLNSDEKKPILLIDEAETHLHYDAQADLVQMLTRQTEVDQVIYTTHSIGCLPEDLGRGVRLVTADSANTSEVKNWFWVSDKPGFSPLLFGMGASTMAFMPVRYALVTEGITDIILLPSLLREATEKEFLGFQIVSGISETSKGNFALLENGAPKTAYLLDADKGGETLRKQLVSAGIESSRIFFLPDKSNAGLVLEDFVDKEVYLNAVNEELTLRNETYTPLSLSDLPEANRPAKVKDWCRNQGIKPPSKRAVAYRVLDQKLNKKIVETKQKKNLKNLNNKIRVALNLH